MLLIAGALAVAGVISQRWAGPAWSASALALLVAVMAPVLDFAKEHLNDREESRRTVEAATEQMGVVGEIPSSDPRWRVHRAMVEIEYQHRGEVQDHLARLLLAGTPTLLIGGSMAGKSRLGVEVARQVAGRRRLVVPQPPDGLAKLMGQGVPSGVLVWLDDLERYLTAGTFEPKWVDQMRAAGTAVLATIRSQEREALYPAGNSRNPAADVVGRFEAVRLTDSPREREQIAARMPQPDLAAGVSRYGLGAFIGGGYLARERYLDGLDTHRLGTAMVRLAMDWRRTGLDDIPGDQIERLVTRYVDDQWRSDPGETESEALSWATDRVHGVVQLLERATDDTYRVADYLLDNVDSDVADIPEEVWDHAVQAAATPLQMVAVALRAEEAHRPSAARTAFQRAIASGHEVAGVAWARLGVLEVEAGDVAAARAAYEAAIASGNEMAMGLAWSSLGDLEVEAGDVAAARAAYGAAITTGNGAAVGLAAHRLGVLEVEAGDVVAARAAYEAAIASGNEAAVGLGGYSLGVLEVEAGDVAAARAAYQAAIASGHQEMTGWAGSRLGVLEAEEGEVAAARAAYRAAIASGNEKVVGLAWASLGDLETEAGEVAAARAAYEAAIASGHEGAVGLAGYRLGDLEVEEGEVAAARAAYQGAIVSGDEAAVGLAGHSLGNLESEAGNVAAARAAYQAAVAGGNQATVGPAGYSLGGLEAKAGNVAAAQAAYQAAIASGHETMAGWSRFGLGALAMKAGDLETARATFRMVIASGHEDVVGWTWLVLGALELEAGDVAASRQAFQRATENGGPVADQAQRELDGLS
ncbi:tetratricopeptide repeat protein [Luteipulveratus mongoliensis]|uniref:tetratricopeptide repeat protein n=1 Tax=Luteipulveratus mongoliensis TaxID=571913 RepID=UPI001470805D|nr:tetratricopeptide repeat protein [Luteipulveratus mongoliensis]